MKKLVLTCLALRLLASVCALAQYDQATKDTTKTSVQEKQAQKPASPTKTVTGCLQKGDEPEEFSIAGEDGKVWGLRSSTVKLEEHVGHKVTVSGTITHESKAEEKKEKDEGQVEKASGKEEYGDLRVTSLKMISDTCSK
jgi:hypothetical protein